MSYKCSFQAVVCFDNVLLQIIFLEILNHKIEDAGLMEQTVSANDMQ